MNRPQKYYFLSIQDIETLSDAVAELDAAKNYFISGAEHIPDLVNACHGILQRALGCDEELVYQASDGSESEAT